MAHWNFCEKCSFRVFTSYNDDKELIWTFIPKGKKPIYSDGKIEAIENDICKELPH